jgi:molybdenum cofactor cytidylyltransferase
LAYTRIESAALDEAAIVYLADKMVQGDRVVSLAERFQRAFATASGKGTLPFVQKRWDTAQSIGGIIERILGADIRRIISPQTDLQVARVDDAPKH